MSVSKKYRRIEVNKGLKKPGDRSPTRHSREQCIAPQQSPTRPVVAGGGRRHTPFGERTVDCTYPVRWTMPWLAGMATLGAGTWVVRQGWRVPLSLPNHGGKPRRHAAHHHCNTTVSLHIITVTRRSVALCPARISQRTAHVSLAVQEHYSTSGDWLPMVIYHGITIQCVMYESFTQPVNWGHTFVTWRASAPSNFQVDVHCHVAREQSSFWHWALSHSAKCREVRTAISEAEAGRKTRFFPLTHAPKQSIALQRFRRAYTKASAPTPLNTSASVSCSSVE